MDKKDLRIVFMGTPDFAVKSLQLLVEGGYCVAGVITMPDKPAGRGYKIQYSPVKEYALSQGLPLLQPEKLKDPEFLKELEKWRADLHIVVAFRMLPEAVWNRPRWGTFNLHASLLPQYRGAAPINWAIINGEKETGVTTFFLTHEIDTGKVIFQERVAITDTDDAEMVHDRLMNLGAGLVVKTVDELLTGLINPVSQEAMHTGDKELKSAPKIFKETCQIDWNQDVKRIYDFIRGLSPTPAARTELQTGKGEVLQLKIFESEKRLQQHELPVGTLVSDGKKYIDVSAEDGFVRLLSIQQAGKKRMPVADFLRGNNHLFA